MSVEPHRGGLTFEGDLPLPDVNISLYRRIYVLEQWLRRIALASLMARYGSQWGNSFSNEKIEQFKTRLDNLKNRVAFNTENSDNLVWCLTMDELGSLLLSKKTWDITKDLTAFHRDELIGRLNDLREIRNVIGHNRAATQYTMDVFGAIERSLDEGIARFRDRMLYDLGGQQVAAGNSDPVVELFFRERSLLGRDQITQDDHFYYAHMLGAVGEPLDLGALLERFDAVRRAILAFLVSQSNAGEYALVWPKTASSQEHDQVVQLLGGHARRHEGGYLAQSPRYACHPRVWFVA